MEKRISYSQFQSVRSVAKACDPLITKRNKVSEKINKLVKEYNDYNTQIESLEAGIKQIIGFSVEELVKKVIEPGVDANGQPKKTTKYLPTDIVSYDEKNKQYVISVPEPNTSIGEGVEVHEDTATDAPVEDTEDKVEDAPVNNTIFE